MSDAKDIRHREYSRFASLERAQSRPGAQAPRGLSGGDSVGPEERARRLAQVDGHAHLERVARRAGVELCPEAVRLCSFPWEAVSESEEDCP